MKKRTTDQERNATNEFFEANNLNEAVVAYFAAPFIQSKIEEGHKRYNSVLDAEEEDIPEGADVLMGEILEMHTYTREAYEQKVFETFKEKFRETFILATIYVPMSQLMKELLNNPDDENLLALFESAMEDIQDDNVRRFKIIFELCQETGMPIEMAEEIADEIGDKEVVLGMVEVEHHCDEEDDECDEGFKCNGECGGHCNCEGKDVCREIGHCQCGNDCKCRDNTVE